LIGLFYCKFNLAAGRRHFLIFKWILEKCQLVVSKSSFGLGTHAHVDVTSLLTVNHGHRHHLQRLRPFPHRSLFLILHKHLVQGQTSLCKWSSVTVLTSDCFSKALLFDLRSILQLLLTHRRRRVHFHRLTQSCYPIRQTPIRPLLIAFDCSRYLYHRVTLHSNSAPNSFLPFCGLTAATHLFVVDDKFIIIIPGLTRILYLRIQFQLTTSTSTDLVTSFARSPSLHSFDILLG
jgi:hypothetical protein